MDEARELIASNLNKEDEEDLRAEMQRDAAAALQSQPTAAVVSSDGTKHGAGPWHESPAHRVASATVSQ